ncbi:MAG: hypothetical protein JXN62_03535, partial [Bacteroidales bacterium]|nr:hypothetical protein [Bacteroidales bacterium]
MTLIFLALLLTVSVNNPAAGNTFNKTQADTVYSDRIIEKVYLHTDRSYYYPGDDIWFKAYLVEAYDRSFSKLSRNLHVELISPSAKIIASRIVKLDSGLGRGDFKLPYDLNPGIYRLRAYTNYMRNFREEIFFNKEINIIRSSAGIKQAAGNNKHEVNSVKLSFFPEGGSLVDNVSSIVAFKAVDAEGKSCSVSGEVYSSAGEMISGFKSTHLGMGTFVLTPDPGLSYYTLADGDGDGDGD